jgi:hypothetical protein
MKKAFALRDGEKLMVARPADPQLALKHGRELVAQMKSGEVSKEDGETRFNQILYLQPYTFVGYYAADTKSILNAEGWAIGKIKPGDSFVGFDVVGEAPTEIGQKLDILSPDADPETAEPA